MLIRTTLTLRTTEQPCGTEADRRKSHGLAYRLEDAPTEWRAGLVAGLFLLQHAVPSRLRLGVGQFFRMVEQSQEYQLAMSLLRDSKSSHSVSKLSAATVNRMVARSQPIARILSEVGHKFGHIPGDA
jgi:hypothetical protein